MGIPCHQQKPQIQKKILLTDSTKQSIFVINYMHLFINQI